MKKQETIKKVENNFRKIVENDKNVKNAYLLVHSDKLNVHLNIAEGKTGNAKANPSQPNHLASVGKLFTSTIISILYEQKKLDFEDKISDFLDSEIINGLHVYKGKEYSKEIKINHLLKQTSGLNDVFHHLLKKIRDDPKIKITPKEAILWGKKNLKPVAKPGKKHFYTDTNYYLLGLIIEKITKKPFHKVMHEFIFKPLKMDHAYMHGFSKPKIKSKYPTAELYIEGMNFLNYKNSHQIDYAGGSVVAPLEEYLIFMKALVNNKIIKKETLNHMINDDISKGFPNIGMSYGYGIWKFNKVPLLMPEKLTCWGCVGITGAYMFYHPETETYIVGSFNDMSYASKALRFMLLKVIKELLNIKK